MEPPGRLRQGRLDPRAVEYRKHLIAALLARAHGVGAFRATRTEGKAATIHLGEESRSPSPYRHGRTRMIVFPGRRSVELKAATASSRAVAVAAPSTRRRRPRRAR